MKKRPSLSTEALTKAGVALPNQASKLESRQQDVARTREKADTARIAADQAVKEAEAAESAAEKAHASADEARRACEECIEK